MHACVINGQVGVGLHDGHAAGAQALLEAEWPPLVGVPGQQRDPLLPFGRPPHGLGPLRIRLQILRCLLYTATIPVYQVALQQDAWG